MPIYQYSCGRCHSTWEVVRAVDDRDLAVQCGKCGHKCSRDLFPGSHIGRASSNDTKRSEESAAGRGIGMKIEGPGKVTMVDCGFLNLERGIVAHEDATISLTRTKFRNVKIDIERERK